MIEHQIINILEAPIQAIAHQANCFHIMGGGVARAIRERYPEAYTADLKTKKGDKRKLGTFSKANTSDGKLIYNVYSQYDLSAGIGDRATQYDMVYEGLKLVEDDLSGSNTILSQLETQIPFVLGIPYRYGCVLGGGSWKIVEAIIHDIFDNSEIDILLCEWPAPQPTNGLESLKNAIERARGGPVPPLPQIGFA